MNLITRECMYAIFFLININKFQKKNKKIKDKERKLKKLINFFFFIICVFLDVMDDNWAHHPFVVDRLAFFGLKTREVRVDGNGQYRAIAGIRLAFFSLSLSLHV